MIIDKIALIKIKNGQVLSTKSKGKTKYYFPGGKRETGESDEQTLIREIREAFRVDLVPNSHKYIGTFKAQSDGMKDGIIVKYCVKIIQSVFYTTMIQHIMATVMAHVHLKKVFLLKVMQLEFKAV